MNRRGFTMVELLIVIVIIAILATIGILTFAGILHRASDSTVQATLQQATKRLAAHNVLNRDYPPNLAGIEFAPDESVGMALYTDAPQTRVYGSLTPDQNAMLLLNSCNASMPIEDASTTYNTVCVYGGNNLHVKGNTASNVVLNGPTLNASDIVLRCGSLCDSARTTIINAFLAQGGTFPVSVPKKNVDLPEYELTTYGSATQFCLEARSSRYDDIMYHTSSDDFSIQPGLCPGNPALHYP